MPALKRAASLAAAILFATGLGAASAPGLAEVPATVAAPAIPTLPVPVPAPSVAAPASDPDTDVTAADQPDFATLDAAVAAQIVPADVSQELTCLAGAIYFESKGEPLAGQLAVAEVIINRAKSGRFEDDICGVVKQRGQFSFVRGGQIPAIDTARRAYRTAMAVAKIALTDAWDSPAPAALYFHARGAGIGRGMTRIAAIGNHIFYR